MMKHDIPLSRFVKELAKLAETCKTIGYTLKCVAAMADEETRKCYEGRQEREVERRRKREVERSLRRERSLKRQ
jgi:hypothetical protein